MIEPRRGGVQVRQFFQVGLQLTVRNRRREREGGARIERRLPFLHGTDMLVETLRPAVRACTEWRVRYSCP